MKTKKREAFYISGYDPRGSRHYYNLYKKEAEKENLKGDIKIEVSSKKRVNENIQSCFINSTSNGKETEVKYNFLEWNNIIRKKWKVTTISLFLDLIFYLRIYYFSGLVFKYAKSSPYQLIAGFYPIIYLLLVLFFSYLTFIFTYNTLYHTLDYGAIFISLLFSLLIIKLLIYIGEKITVFWLLKIYMFLLNYIFYPSKEVNDLIEVFAKNIAISLEKLEKKEIDEVLIISHSVGTILSIPILARALDIANISKENEKNIFILTLGESIPIVSFLPQAKEYKEDMKRVISLEGNCWLDYTSIIDGACFPKLDFYTKSGVEKKSTNPNYLSAKFHTLYFEKDYKKIKRDKYKTHFLYLLSSQKDGNYNFFKMSAGYENLNYYLNKGK